MKDTEARTVITKAILKGLGDAAGSVWGVSAAHMTMSQWNSPSKRTNALGDQVLRGLYLMHSIDAELDGRTVKWLHFAYRK